MFGRVAKTVRRLVRFLAGLFFWLNALLLITVPRPPLDALAARIGLNPSETLLVMFFAAMAVLNCYGFRKLLLDTLYVYGFPFVLAYFVIRAAFKLLVRASRIMPRFVSPPSGGASWHAALALVLPNAAAVTPALSPRSQALPTVTADPANAARKKDARRWWTVIAESARLPFVSFTLFWGLAVAIAQNRFLLYIALAILIWHTASFIGTLGGIAINTNKLLAGAEKRFFEYTEDRISKIMSASSDVADQDLNSATAALVMLRACAFLLLNRAEIIVGILVVGCLVYLVVYVRLALLFAFIYLGLAKLQYIPWSFLDSMVDSFAIPLSYTLLPRNWAIHAAGLVHSAIVISLGIGALVAYARRKLDLFRGMAENVWSRLDEEAVKARIAELWGRMQRTKPTGTTATGQASP
jgi:hypothetical protein